MGSEDFSFMLEAQPKGGFLLFGNGDVGEGSCMVHNPVTTLTMQAWSRQAATGAHWLKPGCNK